MEIGSERKKALQEFCRSLDLEFKDISLLNLAFRHRSSSNEGTAGNNERLEFLGDSVLGMVTASFLYNDLATHTEGELSKIKSVVVSAKVLAPIALKFGFDKMMILGHGEEISGGRTKTAILADAMEAVIGAYYLDSGYDAVEKYVLSFIIPEIRAVQNNHGVKDFKTILQEWYQKKTKTPPEYEVIGMEGPDHDRTFSITVEVDGKIFGPAEGKSKKEAEQRAAEIAVKALNLEQ